MINWNRPTIAEREIEAEVADWIYDVITNQMYRKREGKILSENFCNADCQEFTMMVEKREIIDGTRWYDVYRRCITDENENIEDVLFSLTENSDIFTIERELNRNTEFDYFY